MKIACTVKGVEQEVEEALLEKHIDRKAVPSGVRVATEYRLDGEIVHRSVEFTPNAKEE